MRNSNDSSPTESTLGPGLRIKGTVVGQGDLTIEGALEGELNIDGALLIAGSAEVHANVQAGSAAIEGTFDGELTAQGPVHAGPEAQIHGTITATGLSIDDGARIVVNLINDVELPPELTQTKR